jgi:hypothetical protein
VADKRQMKQRLKQLQRVKTWQLVILLMLSLLLTATFLRLNNIGMIERRTAVLNADERGDEEVTRARLFDLQRYSADHMNADSGVIYLEGQYKRDTEEAIKKASGSSETNINVVADRTCKARFGGYSQAYVQCFAAELAKYSPGSNAPDKAELPSASLYRHEFASPVWSPDFAGFMSAVTVLIGLAIVLRMIGLAVLRVLLHRHYQGV